jgi:hypothetical protein
MKKRFIKILILSGLFFIYFLNSASAQYYEENNNRFFNNLSLNLNAGPTLYFGDIHSSSPFQDDWKLGFGIIARKQFSPVFGLGLQFLGANIHGTLINWPNGDAANLKFDSDLTEFNLHATLNVSNAFFGFKPDRTINLYGLAGVGIANWMTTLRSTLNDDIVKQHGVGADGTNAWTPVTVFPVGFGINISVNSNIGINLESVYHITNSDDLDAYDAGIGKNDPFLYTSVGISFKISGSGNDYSSSSKSVASNYEKDLEKQRKYQQRVTDKERKKQLREEEDQSRRNKIDENKKSWGRRKGSSNLPKVAEYDPQYSFREKKEVKTTNLTNLREEAPPMEVIAIDQGKHFITGVQPKSSSNVIPGTKVQNVNTNTLSSEIIQIPNTGTLYTVQILASQKPANNIADIRLKYYIGKQIFVSNIGGIYRYSAGYFETYDEAVAYSKKIKQNGLSDAFVAIYQNGNRILYRPK